MTKLGGKEGASKLIALQKIIDDLIAETQVKQKRINELEKKNKDATAGFDAKLAKVQAEFAEMTQSSLEDAKELQDKIIVLEEELARGG